LKPVFFSRLQSFLRCWKPDILPSFGWLAWRSLALRLSCSSRYPFFDPCIFNASEHRFDFANSGFGDIIIIMRLYSKEFRENTRFFIYIITKSFWKSFFFKYIWRINIFFEYIYFVNYECLIYISYKNVAIAITSVERLCKTRKNFYILLKLLNYLLKLLSKRCKIRKKFQIFFVFYIFHLYKILCDLQYGSLRAQIFLFVLAKKKHLDIDVFIYTQSQCYQVFWRRYLINRYSGISIKPRY